MLGLTIGFPAIGESQTPVPAASPSSGACTEPDGLTADAAFAHEIDDPRTLAFLSYVENIAPKSRAAIDKRASAPVLKETTDAFGQALSDACDATEVDYRTACLVYMLAKRWSTDEAVDDQGAGRYAIAALFLGDRIPTSVRDAALAVFDADDEKLDTMLAQAEAPPSPSPSSSPGVSKCLGSTAKAILPINPGYPPIARTNGVTGTIQVAVALEKHGFVRTATLFKVKIQPPGASGDDLISEAITAAGSSNYQPAFLGCESAPGKYIFRVEFTRGR